MRKLTSAVLAAALATSSSLAQQPVSSTPPSAPAEAEQVLASELPANTEILLSVNSEVTSTTHRAGDTFTMSVVSDVRIGDQVVIPRGTRAVGEVTWRTGRGAFGKSGKMNIALRYIDLDGTRIPVEGTYRQEGEGNTLATVGGIIAIGVFAGFITGSRARLPVGRELASRTSIAIPFEVSQGRVRVASTFGTTLAAWRTQQSSSVEGQCRSAAVTRARGSTERLAELTHNCIERAGAQTAASR